MDNELESVKLSIENNNNLRNVKENPVVSSVLLAPIKAIPVIGELLDLSIDKSLENFQQKKEQELIDIIFKNSHSITSDMVNDVEFIVNYARVREAVKRLATNDKVKFFGNLIRNGYLSGRHIQSSIFDEYINILNSMSYREILYLVDYKKYCEDCSKKKKSSISLLGRAYNNKFPQFCRDYSEKNNITQREIYFVFKHIEQTGFIEEEFETESGDVDENDNTFNSLSVDSTGYYITKDFLEFYEMVLKMDE
ncbi:MAG: hypothetical protein HFH68_16480 [Lachnospiraceae bacterium]|nr:hypothetical protein [Lachnospiraceae bacterium]